jgi:hypothetical protein
MMEDASEAVANDDRDILAAFFDEADSVNFDSFFSLLADDNEEFIDV